MNYFELFELPISLDIDQTQLKANFLKCQQQHHPDKSVNKEEALIRSSEINQAYKTLNILDSRAAYLLTLVQQDQDLEQSIHDLDFLQDALELREAIEEAQTASELKILKDQIHSSTQQLVETFKSQYNQQQWHEARDIVRKLKFYQRVLNDIDQAEDRLFDDNFDLDDEF